MPDNHSRATVGLGGVGAADHSPGGAEGTGGLAQWCLRQTPELNSFQRDSVSSLVLVLRKQRCVVY